MIEDTITLRVIREAKNEDRSAMGEMIHSYTPVLTYIASCHIRSEELVRSTVRKCLGSLFVLLSETEDLSRFPGKAMSMVVRNCLNAAVSEDREGRLFPRSGSDPAEVQMLYATLDETPSVPGQYTEKTAMDIVVAMLRELPEDQRIVFVMRYLDAMSFERMEQMIHIPAEVLMKRAQLAKRNLSLNLNRTVPEIFGIVKLAEENKYLVLEEEPKETKVMTPAVESIEAFSAEAEPEPLPEPSAEPTAEPMKTLKSLDRRWLAVPAVLAVGMITLLMGFRKPVRIAVMENLSTSFTGVNGAGSAEVRVRDTGNRKLNALLAETSCTLSDADGRKVKEGTLSNGDVLRYSCAFDRKALKKARIEIPETSVEVIVEGLGEPEPIDLFEDVYLYTEIDEESGVVYLYAAPRDSKFEEVYYKVVSQDESGIRIYADIPDERLLTYGLVALDHYHTYPESDIPEETRSLVHQQYVQSALEETASYRDAYGYEVANGSDPSINALAQAYIGRTGACNEIANAFIYDLFGVRVHTGYSRENTYEVDSPEPGDLIYYYDTGGNYRHVATYIGNGLVLNGNYGDGTAHITSMYESWYAANPMTFLRVQR